MNELKTTEWRLIETAPEDDNDILVGGWIGVEPIWQIAISSYVDLPTRRGFKHRNGACWATHWMAPPPPPPLPVLLRSDYERHD